MFWPLVLFAIGVIGLIVLGKLAISWHQRRKADAFGRYFSAHGYRVLDDPKSSMNAASRMGQTTKHNVEAPHLPAIVGFGIATAAILADQFERVVFGAEKRTNAGNLIVYWGRTTNSFGLSTMNTGAAGTVPMFGVAIETDTELPSLTIEYGNYVFGEPQSRTITGDARFDRKTHVRSDHPAEALAVLTGNVRRAILELPYIGLISVTGKLVRLETAQRLRSERLETYGKLLEPIAQGIRDVVAGKAPAYTGGTPKQIPGSTKRKRA